MIDLVGKQLGNYYLSQFLGKGGFADVYLGEDLYLKRQVAIKIMHSQASSSDLQEFLKEAQVLARFDHPHIVRIWGFGEDQQIPYLAMDYAPNGNLRKRYPEGYLVPLDEVVSLVNQIASALQYAHQQKIIHCDIKPQNMLLDQNENVLLSDFGTHKIAHSSQSIQTQNYAGTPFYSSPEQFQGKPLPASDQYALGVVVYEWLCGTYPFKVSSGGDWRIQLEQLARQHENDFPPSMRDKNPQIPVAVEEVVLKALAKKPEERYSHIEEFAEKFKHAVMSQISPKETKLLFPLDNSANPWSTTIEEAPPVQKQQAVQKPRDQEQLCFLKMVNEIWIEGVLNNSLDREVARMLKTQHQPSITPFPRKLRFQSPNGSRITQPPNTSLIDLFDNNKKDLLIVGNPGTGKTTLLLELAEVLISRARNDSTHPIPVIFSLISWTVQLPIDCWLMLEICNQYQVSKTKAEQWIMQDQVYPLFDGLDEVPEKRQTACVDALMKYWMDHEVPMIVCCQNTKTFSQKRDIQFKMVVNTDQLSSQQIDNYLDKAGVSLKPLRELLNTNPNSSLQRMATTPLILSLLILTHYQSTNNKDIRRLQLEETRKQQKTVYSMYVEKMLASSHQASSPDFKSLRGLNWLACILKEQNLAVFSLEEVKKEWLDYRLLEEYAEGSRLKLLFGKLFNKFFALPASRNTGKSSIFDIHDAGYRTGLIVGLFTGLLFLIICALISGPEVGLVEGIFSGLFYGLASVLAAILDAGLVGWLFFELSGGLIFGLVGGLLERQVFGLIFWLIGGGIIGLVIGLILMPVLKAEILKKHHLEILNWSLWRSSYTPTKDFCDFLDDAVKRHLLHKVGNGYRFIHPLLFEYFQKLRD